MKKTKKYKRKCKNIKEARKKINIRKQQYFNIQHSEELMKTGKIE